MWTFSVFGVKRWSALGSPLLAHDVLWHRVSSFATVWLVRVFCIFSFVHCNVFALLCLTSVGFIFLTKEGGWGLALGKDVAGFRPTGCSQILFHFKFRVRRLFFLFVFSFHQSWICATAYFGVDAHILRHVCVRTLWFALERFWRLAEVKFEHSCFASLSFLTGALMSTLFFVFAG